MTADRRAALVEAVAQAISNAWDSEQRIFSAAEAAIDIIRAETLEEAAREADYWAQIHLASEGPANVKTPKRVTSTEIARRIRALKDKS